LAASTAVGEAWGEARTVDGESALPSVDRRTRFAAMSEVEDCLLFPVRGDSGCSMSRSGSIFAIAEAIGLAERLGHMSRKRRHYSLRSISHSNSLPMSS
jgi:hypothetical protein